jgi:hypothetical protein
MDIAHIYMVYYTTRSWGGSLMFEVSRFPRGRSIVAAILPCLGICLTFISLPARGSLDPSALGMDNVLHLDQAVRVNAPPLERSYSPFALAEEVDKAPVNSGLLTMLFLAASYLGASVGWLLANAQRQGALCFSSLGVGEVLGRAREEYLSFLGVFRL